MSDPRSEFTVDRIMAILAAATLAIIFAWVSCGCATCPPPKPCPAPQIVEVDRIIPAPCPTPPPVVPYTPLLTRADCTTEPWTECLRKLLSYIGDLRTEVRELRDVLKAYETIGPTLPNPQP